MRVVVVLGVILALALCVRVYHSTSVVYHNPDAGLWAYFVVNSAKLPVLSTDLAHNALARIMSWDYGWPLFIVHFAWARTLDALQIPINEATIVVPNVAAGVGMCLLAFFVGRAVKDDRAGLMASAFLAVAPLPVMNARSMGRALSPAGFLFLLAVIMLIRYMRRPECPRRRLWAGVSVGLYLCADLQFPVAAVVLLLLMVLWPTPEEHNDPAARLQMFLRPRFLLPPIILFGPYIGAYLYACSLGYPEQTYLGSILVEHSYDWGFHLVSWLRHLNGNTGPVLAAVGLLSVGGLLYQWRNRRYLWLAGWVGITAAPFLFAVTSKVTIASGYHNLLVVGLAIAAGVGVSMLNNRGVVGTVAVIVVASTLFVTSTSVLGVGVPPRSASATPYGGIPPDSGLKAAGYWVRQNASDDRRIHVIHDPAIAYWYMGRDASGLGYTTWGDYRDYLADHARDLDVVVVPETTASWERLDLPDLGFEGLVKIVHDGRVVCRIAARWPVEETLRLQAANARYNRTYNSLDTILPKVGPYVPKKPLILRPG